MKDLFGDEPFLWREPRQIVRREQPHTSFEAASDVISKLGKLQREVYAVICLYGPLTDLDINNRCAALHGKRAESTYRKRRCELVERGLVVDTGRTLRQEGRNRVLWAKSQP